MIDSGFERLHVFRAGRTLALSVLGCVVSFSSHGGTTTYTYDVHGRLTAVTTPSGTDQSNETITYDNADNRTSLTDAYQDKTPPSQPTSLTATAQAYNWISLNWATSVDGGGGSVSYKVYRGGSLLAPASGPPYDDRSVAPNTPYTYTVSAVDSVGNESAQSGSASATTPLAPDLTPPSTPTNLQGAAVSGTWINLTWTGSTDTGGSGLAGYEIFRNNGGSPIGTSTVASYADQAATPATSFSYTVRAYDKAGNRSGMSNSVSVTTPDTVPPSAPGAPTFSGISGLNATASWTAATDNVGVTGYRYSLNGGAWINVGNVLSAQLTGLSLATTYTVQVQAGDAAGNWGSSSSGSFVSASYATDVMSLNGATWGDYYTYQYTGYGPGEGSLTPNTTFNGKTIYFLESYVSATTGQAFVQLTVNGFNGNPGANWLQSITTSLTNTTLTPSSGSFSCSSATSCGWLWQTYVPLSGAQTVTIVHQ
jgi:YD repeat-containing protein